MIRGCYPYQGVWPQVADDVFIAPNASVIGHVRLDAQVGIWFGAVLRGDINSIEIGAGTNIQDNAVIHCGPTPTIMGIGVTVGHSAVIHGSTIGADTLIGMGAVVLNGATIGSGCLIAGGSVVREGAVFGDNVLIAGSPAVVKRPLTEDERARTIEGNLIYRDRAALLREELSDF